MPNVLVDPGKITVTVAPPAVPMITTVSPVREQVTQVVNVGMKGDRGEAGQDGQQGQDAMPFGKIKKIDVTRPVAYVGYDTLIKRLDYNSFPPEVRFATVADLEVAWPIRTTLTYN